MERKEIYLAGGCFWGTEKYLKSIPGVKMTEVGYANGIIPNPSYEDVCHRNTGHAETVRVKYEPKYITLTHLLNLFLQVIDPTSVNRQGNDIGNQYRTGIYYVDPKDETIILAAITELQKKYDKRIAVEIKPLKNYYPAEEYHQDYLTKNPNSYCHIEKDAFDRHANPLSIRRPPLLYQQRLAPLHPQGKYGGRGVREIPANIR
ncbi:MAG: peptide-methionine (S)-S-oxide reductase MsrA [Desulfitobacteriaceae bacterium]|nr:peptide-methionine (S)-S-oxide reductase MsrA [Desulfitobacteriaceae bacterium]MDD4402069.1 peptide-methionine (S)-S-oxide reductase MsrA [Desulfitobacteriaceae bacterium]